MPLAGSMSRWEPQRPGLGSVNAVLVARSRRHSVKDFPGPLSIKTVIEGEVAWKVGQKNIVVDDSSFLVLNNKEPYSMEIDTLQPVATCCVFFQHGFVEAVGRDLANPLLQGLDDPYKLPATLSFLSRLHLRNRKLTAHMTHIHRQVIAGPSSMELEEGFLSLAVDLLLLYEEIKKQIARIPAIRQSTRQELFARLARGREFLHAEAYGPVTLGDAARAACMSPFHFQRSFVRAFGMSPHQYVTELRLQRAIKLLKVGISVTDVCMAVGFESLGSFCTKFRRHFGVSPSVFRS